MTSTIAFLAMLAAPAAMGLVVHPPEHAPTTPGAAVPSSPALPREPRVVRPSPAGGPRRDARMPGSRAGFWAKELDEVHPPLPAPLLLQYLTSRARILVVADLAGGWEIMYNLKRSFDSVFFVDVESLPTAASFTAHLEANYASPEVSTWVFVDSLFIGGARDAREQLLHPEGRLRQLYHAAGAGASGASEAGPGGSAAVHDPDVAAAAARAFFLGRAEGQAGGAGGRSDGDGEVRGPRPATARPAPRAPRRRPVSPSPLRPQAPRVWPFF